MTDFLRVITVAGDPEREATLAKDLDRHPHFEVVLRCVDRVEVLGAIRGGRLDAVVSVGDPPWLDEEVTVEARQGGIRLVAVVEDPLGAERFRAFGAHVLPYATEAAEIFSILRTQAPPEPARPQQSGARSIGTLIAVWGPKGAPGRSTIAIELAAELAAADARTLLIDADTYGGDIVQMYGITEELPTLVWAARMASKDELDEERFAAEWKRAGPSGPVVIPGIPRADLWPEISAHGWTQLLSAATNCFRFVVCDIGFCVEPETSPYPNTDGRNRIARSTLGLADHMVGVLRADPVGVKNFLWALEEVGEIVDPARVLVVANRTRPGEEGEITAVIRRYLRRSPVAYVPEVPDIFSEAIGRGVSASELRPGSVVSQAMRSVAAAVGASVPAQGFLTRLTGRK